MNPSRGPWTAIDHCPPRPAAGLDGVNGQDISRLRSSGEPNAMRPFDFPRGRQLLKSTVTSGRGYSGTADRNRYIIGLPGGAASGCCDHRSFRKIPKQEAITSVPRTLTVYTEPGEFRAASSENHGPSIIHRSADLLSFGGGTPKPTTPIAQLITAR